MKRTAFVAFALAAALPVASMAQAISDTAFEERLSRLTTTPLTTPERVSMTMNNRKALYETLALLRMAKPGDTFYSFYYIHGNDEVASRYHEEMLAAAKRGVKIVNFADYLTNYTRLDTFNMLRAESGGNISTHFYGVPTAGIHQDLIYMTMPCGGVPDCADKKEEIVQRYAQTQSGDGTPLLGSGHFFSRLLLAGISAKSGDAIKAALSQSGVGEGASGQAGKISDEERAQLVDFGQLVFRARIQGNLIDQIKLQIALILYGEKVGPLLEAVENTISLRHREGTRRAMEWENLTEFLHDKAAVLVRADGQEAWVKNSGRNLENSYFVNPEERSLTNGKYTFADTDNIVRYRDAEVVRRLTENFQSVIDYRDGVASLELVNTFVPVDLVKEPELVKQAIDEVKATNGNATLSNFDHFSMLVQSRFWALASGKRNERQQAARRHMEEKSRAYREAQRLPEDQVYRPDNLMFTVRLNKNEDPNARAAYLVNRTFRDGLPDKLTFWQRIKQAIGWANYSQRGIRTFNTVVGKEAEQNKNIHAAMIESLKKLAAEANEKFRRTGERTPVYIHQGYVLLPSNLVNLLGQMMRGEIDSQGLEIHFVTNSIQTTDLAGINMLARHQLRAMFEYFDRERAKGDANGRGVLGDLRFHEQQVFPDGQVTSLHSKALYGGDIAIIGSANADPRSYDMDSNNAQIIINAPNFVGRITDHMQKLVNDAKIMKETTSEYRRPHHELLAEDIHILDQTARSKKWGRHLLPHLQTVTENAQQMGLETYVATGLILDPQGASWIGRESVAPTAVATTSRAQADGTATAGGAGGASASGSRRGAMCAIIFGPVSVRGASAQTVRQMVDRLSRLRPDELKNRFNRALQVL